MGGLCSRSLGFHLSNAYSKSNFQEDEYKGGSSYQSAAQVTLLVPQVRECMVKQAQGPRPLKEIFSYREKDSDPDDDFYDGIPRLPRASSQKSRSVASTQAAVAKVTEMSAFLGKAGTLGLDKAVEVLDTLGSSMTSLNVGSGFAAGVTTKGNELKILAFEVANTIVKGSNLMQSLSKRSIKHLKETVLHSEGVQNLVTEDMNELLRIAATDKRQELKIFSGEVVRFGNRSKDPQWHNLERYFDRIASELTPQRQLKEDAEVLVERLMVSVHYTAELYHEMQVLDKLDQDYKRKLQEEDNSAASHKGDGIAILKAELKRQQKDVKSLRKKSLWLRSLEEVMEKLVDIVHYLLLEIHNTFHDTDCQMPEKGAMSKHQRLGPAGLALHYANIITQIDSLVSRSNSIPSNARDALYQNLPPSIKSALRSKMQSFHVEKELTVTQIKGEMEKTLRWLVPIAANTTKAHHGFGWVGEWANNAGADYNDRAGGQGNILLIETLYHANKEKTETYIFEQVLWLQYLVGRSKAVSRSTKRSTIKSKIQAPIDQQPKHENRSLPLVTDDERKMLEKASRQIRIPRVGKSHDFDLERERLAKHDRLSKSSDHTPIRRTKSAIIKRFPSGLPLIDLGIDKERALDMIDRVDVVS